MAATAMPSSNCPATPSAGGLGISMVNARKALDMTKQFTFVDGTVNGQPVVTATLTQSGASAYSDIAQGFSAQYIGDVCNLSRIIITLPRSNAQTSVDQGIALINVVLTGTLPLDVQLNLLSWLVQNYSALDTSGTVQTTIKNMQFTLQNDQNNRILDILPAK
jgi:hypothetical protein